MNDSYMVDDEIDLLALFRALKKQIAWFILSMLFFGGLAWGGTKFLLTPQYSASSGIYTMSQNGDSVAASYYNMQLGSQLKNDYEIIIKSHTILDKVVNRLEKYDLTYKDIQQMITIENPEDSRVLHIIATCENPEVAAEVANTTAEVATRNLAKLMSTQEPIIFEYAQIPTKPSSPNVKKITLLGILLGFLLVAGITTVRFLLDDSIKKEEDVEKYLGLYVMGTIPSTRTKKKEKREKA